MKTSHRVLLAATALGAVSLAGYQVIGSLKGPVTHADLLRSEKSRGGDIASAAPPEEAEAPRRSPSPRPRKAENAIPSGIDSETWKQSSAIVTLMNSMPDEIMSQGPEFMPASTSGIIRERTGMDDASFENFMKLVNTRNQATKDATKAIMDEFLRDPRKMTELIALSTLSEKGQLQPEQMERLAELAPDKDAFEAGIEENLKPWYEDADFLAGARATLDEEGASLFDAYAEEQRLAGIAEKVSVIARTLDLDEAQQAAMGRALVGNPDEESALMSVLTPEQKVRHEAMKPKNGGTSVKISSGAF